MKYMSKMYCRAFCGRKENRRGIRFLIFQYASVIPDFASSIYTVY